MTHQENSIVKYEVNIGIICCIIDNNVSSYGGGNQQSCTENNLLNSNKTKDSMFTGEHRKAPWLETSQTHMVHHGLRKEGSTVGDSNHEYISGTIYRAE